MARKKRSEKDLAAAAGRLHAEVRRFTLLVNALVAPPRPLPPVAVEALQDAFLDHARALVHFLYPTRPRAQDVLAADFFPAPRDWDRVRLPPSARLKAVRGASRPERLTWAAAPAREMPEPRRVLEIANDVSAGISVFLRHAPPGTLGDRWREVRGEP